MLWWTLRQLRSKDSRKRGFAVVGLGKSGNAKPVDPLITALRDPVWGVRRLAVEALEGLKYEPADESHKAMMLVACHKWDEAVKLGPAAIEPLVGEFRDHDYSVRGRAADALAEIGFTAVEPLISALKDSAENVRCCSARALGSIGDGRAVEPLIFALRDSDEDVRSKAAIALGRIGDILAVESLISTFNDSSGIVRSDAGKALAQIGSTAVEPLISALKDSAENVRASAAVALGEIGDGRAIEPLITLLSDSSEVVRRKAGWALEKLKSGAADQLQLGQSTLARHYSNRDWGFELDYPANWKIQVENDRAGSWTVAVIIVGDASSSGKPGIIVNARRGPVLAGGGGSRVSQVYVIGSGGSSPQLPKTVHEFIEKAKKDLASSFRGFHLLSSDETKIADGPAAQNGLQL